MMGIIRLLAEGCTFDTAARSVDLRSKSIINEYIDGVLTAFMDAVQSTKGQGPTLDCSISFPETAEEIESEKQLWVRGKSDDDQRFAAFRGCFGAGNGTLIPVLIKKDESFHIEAHRNGRKGLTAIILFSHRQSHLHLAVCQQGMDCLIIIAWL